MTQVAPKISSSRPPFWRDIKRYGQVGQFVFLVVIALIIAQLVANLFNELNRKGIPSDFNYLSQPTEFDIPENRGFDQSLPRWRMVLIGLQNTVLASALGIVLASALGLIIGVARLSSNWLVAKLSAIYVEVFRNIPPLVMIIFFSIAVFSSGPFPVFQEALELKLPGSNTNWLVLSNREVGVPSFSSEGGATAFWIIVLAGLALSAVVWRWRTKVSVSTGKPHHRVVWSFLVLLLVVVAAFNILGGPYDWSWPARSENGRRLVTGFSASSAYLSVALALAIYTASHIAEIVRGSILAVQKGQGEAASSLALSSFQRYRYVILPQALRTALPSITNQYLNLTKNTSLAAAVGYAELAYLTDISIGNDAPAPQSMLVMMAAYLVLSLIISVIANFFNRLLKLKER